MSSQRYIETPAKVRAERGTVRLYPTIYGLDGASIVETGEVLVLTPYAARAVAERILRAVEALEAERDNVVKMKDAG